MRNHVLKNTVVISIILGAFTWFGYAAPTERGGIATTSVLKQWFSKSKGSETKQKAGDTASGMQLTAVQPITTQQLANPSLDTNHLFKAPDENQQQAFQGVTEQAMPMTPDQIVQLKKMLNVTQQAAAASALTPPEPRVSTQIVNLSPGATPPVIRLQQGFVTSVVFVDSTGADWPIDSYDVGNSRAFNIQVARGSNTMMIQAMSLYNYGNLAVTLKNLSTPIMLTLIPGQQVVDYRVDLQVQGTGPNAVVSANSSGVSAPVSNTLLNVLDGVPPQNATVLQVSDGETQAWSVGKLMYLRTRFTVLSPSWIGTVTSPDGTKAYEMEKSPTLLLSKYGQPTAVTIEGL